MIPLRDVRTGMSVRGIVPDGPVRIVGVERYGDRAIKVVYEDGRGAVGSRLVYDHEEPMLELSEGGGRRSFDGDGGLLRLVSEAMRISLAHLFDPYLAVHTSRIEPLPHQITAVYGDMLQRQPLQRLPVRQDDLPFATLPLACWRDSGYRRARASRR